MQNQITLEFNAQSEMYELPDSPTIQELFYDPDTKTLNVDWAWLEDHIDEVIELDELAEEWANRASNNRSGLFGSQMEYYPNEYFLYAEGRENLACLYNSAQK